MKRACIVMAIMLSVSLLTNMLQSLHIYKGVRCAIPDENTAIAVAEGVLRAAYGQEVVTQEQPYTAEYDKLFKVWKVYGTLPEGWLGGVCEVHIRKKDGKILYIGYLE